MIDFEHVTKVYETQNDENVALEDINIHIDEGEFVFILGHSGAWQKPRSRTPSWWGSGGNPGTPRPSGGADKAPCGA